MNNKLCVECGKQFQSVSPKFCSRNCFHVNYGKNHRGVASPRWKGDRVEYHGIHRWLTQIYGRRDKCEHCGKLRRLHWAKMKGKEYERKRENFIELCSSCHKKYDMTEQTKQRMSASRKGVSNTWLKGIKRSPEVREKISKSLKKYFKNL